MSLYVTDTHPLVWYAGGRHAKLSAKALTSFQQAEASRALIYIPAVSFWEVALLEKFGKVNLRDGFARWAAFILSKRGFAMLPLEISAIAQAASYNLINDPFDSIIVASAAEVGVPLISKDVTITESNLVETWW